MRAVIATLVGAVGLVSSAYSGNGIASLRHLRPEVRWEASAVSADYDGDGKPDLAFLGHLPDKVLVGVLVSTSEEPQVLEFGIGAGEQAAVCSANATLKVESLEYHLPRELKDSRAGKGLQLADDECDSIHMYWNAVKRRVEWWRL